MGDHGEEAMTKTWLLALLAISCAAGAPRPTLRNVGGTEPAAAPSRPYRYTITWVDWCNLRNGYAGCAMSACFCLCPAPGGPIYC